MDDNNGAQKIASFFKDETTLARLSAAIAEMKQQSDALLSDVQSILHDIDSQYS